MATEIDGIAGSQLRDSQGEMLDIKGCDISELEAGRGYINDNHSNKLPDVLGRITNATKIFGPEDCKNDRQKYFWNKVKAPYIYFTAKLYDDEGDHRSAKATAAILRHQHKDDSPLKLKASVEGGIIERGEKDETLLKRTKLKGVALTFVPANNATLVEGLNLKKSINPAADEALIKSLVPLARNDVPSFIEVADILSETKIRSNIEKIRELAQALVAAQNSKTDSSLEKSVGRISFPKMLENTRPDQDVDIKSDNKYAGRLFRQVDYSAGVPHEQSKEYWDKFLSNDFKPLGLAYGHKAVTLPEGVKESENPDHVREHESAHTVFNRLSSTYGDHIGNSLLDRMIGFMHPDDHKMMARWLGKAHPNGEYSKSEFVTSLRDFLTEKNYRESIIAHHPDFQATSVKGDSPERLNSHITSRMKKAWHAMRRFSNELDNPFGDIDGLAEKHRPDYNLGKALTAGFGGGSPTDATGGQVLQTESLDGGLKTREIECPSCGKSNVYMKYQTRCRHCSKAYPFDTLAKFFTKE